MEVGDFELMDVIAAGAMSEVWSARHRVTGEQVVVKFLAGARLGRPDYVQAFMQEVRSHAGLRHPSIITLFDYGLAGVDGIERPFLAMEKADGTLRDMQLRNWRGLREATTQVLDALRYAHSRGVVHRDLKPGNVLLVDGRLKLSDFGLSYSADAIETGTNPDIRAGTPLYMSPEQVRGEWRLYGAWTDLYALGLMVWELACGRPPFEGLDYIETAAMQLDAPLPPLDPLFDVPEALDDWLQKLTAKNPFARLPTAADAAWELSHVAGRLRVATPVLVDDNAIRDTQTLLDVPPVLGGPAISAPEIRPAIVAPPMTDSWPTRRYQDKRSGLGLFALRPLPPAGHLSVRQHVWNTLREVVDGEGFQMTWLGDSGSGDAAAIGDWFAEVVVEAGVAKPLVFRHTVERGPRDGFAGCLERTLGAWNLEGRELRAHLSAVARMHGPIRHTDVDVVAAELDPANHSGTSDMERYRVLVSMIARHCAERPVVVIVQDAQWALDVLFFLEVLNTTFPHLPIYALGVVAKKAVEETSLAATALERLMMEPRARVVDVHDPSPEEHRERVGRMLTLAPETLDRIAEKSHPDARYASMLIAYLARIRALESADTGFELVDGTDLPEFEVLLERQLEWALDGIESDEGRQACDALEVAAFLGMRPPLAELQRAWDEADVSIGTEASTRLTTAGLLVDKPGAWQFPHPEMSSCLKRRAEARGTAAAWHRVCAAALTGETTAGAARGYWARRIADHARDGGIPDVALEPLQFAISTVGRGNIALARDLLKRRAGLLATVECDRASNVWFEQRLHEAMTDSSVGNHDEAVEALSRLAQDARDAGLHLIEGRALLALSRIMREAGDTDGAYECFERILDVLADEPIELARALVHYAWMLHRQGLLRESEARYRQALKLLPPDHAVRIDAQTFLAVTLLAGDHFARAREVANRALAQIRRCRDVTMLPEVMNTLAEIERFDGNWDEARRLVEATIWWRSLSPHRYMHVYDFNRALLALGTHRFGQARALLEPLYDAYRESGMLSRVALLDAAYAACTIGWGSAMDVFDEKMDALEASEVIHRDIAWCMDIAADISGKRGDKERAARALKVAARHYLALGLPHRVRPTS